MAFLKWWRQRRARYKLRMSGYCSEHLLPYRNVLLAVDGWGDRAFCDECLKIEAIRRWSAAERIIVDAGFCHPFGA